MLGINNNELPEEFSVEYHILIGILIFPVVIFLLFFIFLLFGEKGFHNVTYQRLVFCSAAIIFALLVVVCLYSGFANDRRLVKEIIFSREFLFFIFILSLSVLSITSLVFISIYLFP